ncbi:hypothetical protein Sme01_02880 [Sphaerisporangium melleum]|uniref:Head-to-tail stopper n=1 Tax=Sphaerisporangium melleum TaxID=321316 RepID=A0A917QPV8_9ACTN|nr:hypothetical protein [Sphaerisporangium melleum]GGK61238.1 hypothetical protein GCM10007964_00420 [Sphaerisporangium melleum]GII67812.1 hypothetical protein Sme01_02880 [Sphaerisporangium melleum]
MPLPLPQGETITVLNPGAPTRDSAGNYLPGADIETPIEGCAIWPTGSTEDTDTQDQTAERLSVLIPPGTPVSSISRVRVWGYVYNVTGAPMPWRSPLTGTSAGIELHLERVSG